MTAALVRSFFAAEEEANARQATLRPHHLPQERKIQASGEERGEEERERLQLLRNVLH